MNLEQLVEEVKKSTVISPKMHNAAISLLKEPKETYTLEEYATLMYVIGGYEEVKGLSAYTGVRIQDAMTNKIYRVEVTDAELDSKIIDFKDTIMQRVDAMNKTISKRFLNLNLIIIFIFFLIVIYLFKVNVVVALLIAAFSFVINYFLSLPKIKRNVLKNQMLALRNELEIQELKDFEEQLY